jgi:protein TonB
MTDRNNVEDEGLSPPDKKLSSLPPRIAAKIRRQRARQRLQEQAQEVEPPAEAEEGAFPPEDEPQEEVSGAVEAAAPLLASLEEDAKEAQQTLLEDLPPEHPAPDTFTIHEPPPSGPLDIRPRKAPTVSGFMKELGRGAWESVSDLVGSQVRRLKKRDTVEEKDFLLITEDSLVDRRQKIRGYVLLSSAIHMLLFMPLIHFAMLQEPEKKEPVYVRIMDTPPPAKKVEKKTAETKTTKTDEKVTKVLKAKGPRPEPKPVTRPTPTKTYASPKKILVAKASQPKLEAPAAPRVPKPAPTRLEAPRPKTTTAPLREEPIEKVTTPTRPIILPDNFPKEASLSENVTRQSPVATRPTDMNVQMPTIPDTEGRAQQLRDAVPETFRESDSLAAPTAAPPLPQSQTPAPSVLGQAATTASRSAPESPNVLAPGSATSTTRPVDERRTTSTVEARLGGEVGPVTPVQVALTDASELGPVGSAPTEFQDEITVPLNSDDPRFKEYLEAVKRRILEIWRYPDDAEPGLRGKVSIEFSIERDGSVSKVNVKSTSGHSVLDQGATDAMRLASPFPPLPSEFNTNRLNVVGGFRYN